MGVTVMMIVMVRPRGSLSPFPQYHCLLSPAPKHLRLRLRWPMMRPTKVKGGKGVGVSRTHSMWTSEMSLTSTEALETDANEAA